MLSTLTIHDVVLIDRLELEFGTGLCALTGETGAGKSILLDALGLALGGRADAKLVRQGANQASVSARFDIADNPAIRACLEEQEILSTVDDLVLRRTVGIDGRSRAFINDQAVSVSLLKKVGGLLIEVHGQFESQRLLEPSTHRDLLDSFGDLAKPVAATVSAWKGWQAAIEAHSRAIESWESARRDEDFLRHAVEELDALDPQKGEEEDLAERRSMMMNAEKLTQALDEAAHELSSDGRTIDTALRGALRHLERVAERAEGRLDPVIMALDRAASEAEEAQSLLDRVAADMDLDPRYLEKVEERLFRLRAVARKHNCETDNLKTLREDFAARLMAVEDGSDRVARLHRQENEARDRYCEAATFLSSARSEAAMRLDAAVAKELGPLRLGKATFTTTVQTLDEKTWGEHGWDRIVFEVATNPGSPPGPLSRIASGGELSRFMLALKVVLAHADPVPTLIFDEVDSGIGGAVAAAVGDRLAHIARDVQVLVVTHSPQVAARGKNHWRVSKQTDGNQTRTQVDRLDADQRKEEIARMLAGARVTDEARAAADSLLQSTGT